MGSGTARTILGLADERWRMTALTTESCQPSMGSVYTVFRCRALELAESTWNVLQAATEIFGNI